MKSSAVIISINDYVTEKQGVKSAIDSEKFMELHGQGKTDSEMALFFNVSKSTICRFRNKQGLEPNKGVKRLGRKPTPIDESAFLNLYDQGLSDSVIAESLGVSRQLVIRLRQKHGLRPNRRVGERGLGKLRDSATMLEEARRYMRDPEVSRIIYGAVRKHLENGGDEASAWAATVIEPARMFHPAPGPNLSVKISKTQVEYAVQIENRADWVGICGVPSVELLEKARELRGIENAPEQLADLVKESGYVGVHQLVSQVRKPNPTLTWREIWDNRIQETQAWAEENNEARPKRITLETIRSWTRQHNRVYETGGTGKVGKGGGRQNIEVRRAYAAAAGQ